MSTKRAGCEKSFFLKKEGGTTCVCPTLPALRLRTSLCPHSHSHGFTFKTCGFGLEGGGEGEVLSVI